MYSIFTRKSSASYHRDCAGSVVKVCWQRSRHMLANVSNSFARTSALYENSDKKAVEGQ